jgi:2-C-methyl-D-erythritol 4-phosphate cytidylyltransferase/2-C-methyl-D-erythritol 2,4-cyclodiphosphate synthase
MMRVLNGILAGNPAVIPGIPVNDTIKEVSPGTNSGEEPASKESLCPDTGKSAYPGAPGAPGAPGTEGSGFQAGCLGTGGGNYPYAKPAADSLALFVAQTHPRERLRAVQTPQGFLLRPLIAAHEQAAREGWDVTDDAAIMERAGHRVLVVEGEEANRKITLPVDLTLINPLEKITVSERIPCTGLGYDVHRYGGERPFILGGVPIACDVTIAAHSDGDTLLHALMDALLGCIGGGDIGGLFPDTDPAYENISSGVLLSEVRERCLRLGLIVRHVDITVIAQTPRIAPHRQNIAANVARLLHLPADRVNVKATTEEHLGFTGEKKGIKVLAVVTGDRPAVL